MSEKEVNKIIEVYDSVIADLKQALSNIKWRLENTIITKKEIIDIVNKALGSDNNE